MSVHHACSLHSATATASCAPSSARDVTSRSNQASLPSAEAPVVVALCNGANSADEEASTLTDPAPATDVDTFNGGGNGDGAPASRKPTSSRRMSAAAGRNRPTSAFHTAAVHRARPYKGMGKHVGDNPVRTRAASDARPAALYVSTTNAATAPHAATSDQPGADARSAKPSTPRSCRKCALSTATATRGTSTTPWAEHSSNAARRRPTSPTAAYASIRLLYSATDGCTMGTLTRNTSCSCATWNAVTSRCQPVSACAAHTSSAEASSSARPLPSPVSAAAEAAV